MGWFDELFVPVNDTAAATAAAAALFLPPRAQAVRLAPPAPEAPPIALAPPPTAVIEGLDAALTAANPAVDHAMWLPALNAAMAEAELTTPRRIAAFLGQVSQEAGPGFRSIKEDLYYTHAERIHAIYPREFPTVAAAAPFVGQPEKLADVCYANKNGNGGPGTGDGWRFRGRGLIQVTGRDAYARFAASINRPIDEAAAFAETPDGAAASACWFWTSRDLNPLADDWDLDSITRHVNGPGMAGHAERVAMSQAALAALGG